MYEDRHIYNMLLKNCPENQTGDSESILHRRFRWIYSISWSLPLNRTDYNPALKKKGSQQPEFFVTMNTNGNFLIS